MGKEPHRNPGEREGRQPGSSGRHPRPAPRGPRDNHLRTPERAEKSRQSGRENGRRLWQEKHRVGKVRPSGLHLDTHKPGTPEVPAAPHRQGRRSRVRVRAPNTRRGPPNLSLPPTGRSQGPPPAGNKDVGSARRPTLGHGGPRKWRIAEDRGHGGLVPGSVRESEERKPQGTSGNWHSGGEAGVMGPASH